MGAPVIRKKACIYICLVTFYLMQATSNITGNSDINAFPEAIKKSGSEGRLFNP